ncbi:unnamed protein product [Blepharisma stoltei]|uniref:Uncharacterized protein n=1 Tax=Blepharisma stoltei TaxID=1481888 RepID=A0AAU9K2K3_9CILI|nr:unnamed protein product [Blepharisma stoltei]
MAFQNSKQANKDSFFSSCSNSERPSINLRSQFKRLSQQAGCLIPFERADSTSSGSSISTATRKIGYHNWKTQRHLTCFTPKSPTNNLQMDQDRMISCIIQDCDMIKDEILGARKSVERDASVTRKNILSVSQIENSEKFQSLIHEDYFEKEKKKIEENYKNLHHNEELDKKYDKVRSLLTPSREGKAHHSRFPNLEVNVDKQNHYFITSEDLIDTETAHIISLNKRCFGENFSPKIKESPEKSSPKAKAMINASEISPEETILTDIKSIISKKSEYSPRKAKSPNSSCFPSRMGSERIFDKMRIQHMSPLNQQIFHELDRLIPQKIANANKRSQPLFKSKNFNMKNKNKSNRKEESYGKKSFNKKGEIQSNYFQKKVLDKNVMELFKGCKIEPKDFKLKRRVERLLTARQNLGNTKKEVF